MFDKPRKRNPKRSPSKAALSLTLDRLETVVSIRAHGAPQSVPPEVVPVLVLCTTSKSLQIRMSTTLPLPEGSEIEIQLPFGLPPLKGKILASYPWPESKILREKVFPYWQEVQLETEFAGIYSMLEAQDAA